MLTEQERNERIIEARKLICWDADEEFDSDQELHREQPPLFKEKTGGEIIPLCRDFSDIPFETDFVTIINERKSSRVYTMKDISFSQLSFLCWSAEGVKGVRGKRYAALRTVPSGGARHPFELYPLILRCGGVRPGLYHYVSDEHALELIKEVSPEDNEFMNLLNDGVCGQKWILKSSVIFFYSIIPYRGEWRYGPNAHRVMMMDAGHTMENLYITCSAMGLGTCAIGAVDSKVLDKMFILDGEEEYMLCCCPVGTISEENSSEEKDFYAFLKTEEQFYHKEN